MNRIPCHRCGLATAVAILALNGHAPGGGSPSDVVLASPFADAFVPLDLGEVPGITGPLGGVAFAPGDPDTLLIAGSATAADGAVYAVPLDRNACDRIVGYAGPAVLLASTPYIDGGLTHGPGGVMLYTTYPNNTLGQVGPGQRVPSRITDLTLLGVNASTGATTIVPAGLRGAGRLKIASYTSGAWYDAALVPDGPGTFDITDVTPRGGTVGPGPEGIVYVPPGYPRFPDGGVLVTKWSAYRVDAYDVDANGDPIVATERVFIDQLAGAEGACLDPVMGDLVFSSLWVVDRVVVVRALPACAGDIAPPGGDGVVTAGDYIALITQWGPSCSSADLDLDGDVDFGDVMVLFGNWGPCSQP